MWVRRHSVLTRITREDEIASLGGLVTGKTGLVQRLVSRFATGEVGESPAASRGVLLRVLDHELNIHGGTGNERSEAGAGKAARQDFVVLCRRRFIPMQRGNNG